MLRSDFRAATDSQVGQKRSLHLTDLPMGLPMRPGWRMFRAPRLASISTVPEVLTLRTGLHSNTEDSPVGALAIASTEFRNLVILYRIHHSLPRAVSAV